MRVTGAIEHSAGPRRQLTCQTSAQKRLHHKYRKPAFSSRHEPRRSRLVTLAGIVVLYLAKIPVICVKHRQEIRRAAVIRKTNLANAPRSLLAHNPILDTQCHHAFPLGGRGDVVHEVVVDMVSPQAAQLLIKETVEILRALARGVRQLGREQNLVAQAQALKRSAYASLVAGIKISRIQVIYPLLHGAGNDSIGCLRIGASRRTGKPHAPQPQRRDTVTAFGVNAILHGPSSPIEALTRRNKPVTPPKHIGIAIENVS